MSQDISKRNTEKEDLIIMLTIDGHRCPCSAVYLCQRKRNILDTRDVKYFRRMHVCTSVDIHSRHLKCMQYTCMRIHFAHRASYLSSRRLIILRQRYGISVRTSYF